jgi:hypothetical protein
MILAQTAADVLIKNSLDSEDIVFSPYTESLHTAFAGRRDLASIRPFGSAALANLANPDAILISGSHGGRQYRVVLERAYRILTDEETGGDEIWDALHDYADFHPAPEALQPFVSRNELGNFTGIVVDRTSGIAAIAWLADARRVLGWDERTTPVLVVLE